MNQDPDSEKHANNNVDDANNTREGVEAQERQKQKLLKKRRRQKRLLWTIIIIALIILGFIAFEIKKAEDTQNAYHTQELQQQSQLNHSLQHANSDLNQKYNHVAKNTPGNETIKIRFENASHSLKNGLGGHDFAKLKSYLMIQYLAIKKLLVHAHLGLSKQQKQHFLDQDQKYIQKYKDLLKQYDANH